MCVCCGSSRGGGGAGPACSWLPAKGVDVAREVPQPLLVAPSNRGSQLASVGPSMQAVCGSRQGPLLRCVVRCAALAHLLKSLCSLCHCLWGCRHCQWILVVFVVPCIQAVALLVDWARVFWAGWQFLVAVVGEVEGMVVVCADSPALFWGGGLYCRGVFTAAVQLLPVLLLCPFGLQLQQWPLDCCPGCVAIHTPGSHCMQRVHRYRSCKPLQGVVVTTKAACGTLHCLGISGCVRACAHQHKNIFLLWSVCAECV